MNEKQIEAIKAEGWPEPKFRVGDQVRHWARDHKSIIGSMEINEKRLSDYGIKAWCYFPTQDDENSWWGECSDLEAV